MKLNVTFKEQNDTFKADFGEVAVVESSNNPLEYASNLGSLFSSVAFPQGFECVLNLPKVTRLQSTFQYATGIEKITIKGNVNGNAINASNFLYQQKSVTTVDFTEFDANISISQYMFYYASALKEILGVLNFTNSTNHSSAFFGCGALEEVRFKESSILKAISFATSSLLSAESVQSIIDGLATVTTAQTLALHPDITAILTTEQYNAILAKNWNIS